MQGTFAGWFSKQSIDHLNSSTLIFFSPLEYSDPVSKHGCQLKAHSEITQRLGQELIRTVKLQDVFKNAKYKQY